MVYIMTKKAINSRSYAPLPSKSYYSVLDKGYKTFGFSVTTLREALLEALNVTKPTTI